jgi:hypothetical protein
MDTIAPLLKEGILGIAVVALAGVIYYQNKRIEFLYKEKDDLQERRLTGTLETANKYNEAMGEFSRTLELLASKIGAK